MPCRRMIFLVLALFASCGIAWGEVSFDPGQPDTIWVECGNKAVHDSGGWVTFDIYLKTDNQGAGTDIAGMDLPLLIRSSNPLSQGSLDTTVNKVFLNSVFNVSGALLSAAADSLNLNGFMLVGAAQFSTTGPQSGKFLAAKVWVHLTDSTTIEIDTTSRGNSTLLLVTSDAASYVPVWRKGNCGVCVHSSPPGDATCSGSISLADVIYIINIIFKGAAPPCCPVLGDTNCSGNITLADAIYLLNHIFKGTPAPVNCSSQ